jgi:hypothetical protein
MEEDDEDFYWTWTPTEQTKTRTSDEPRALTPVEKIAIAKRAFQNAKDRARRRGVPFLFHDWTELPEIPDHCPIFGMLFAQRTTKKHGGFNPSSPSLDCIWPSRGYGPGLVVWVSAKANTMKSNATIAQLEDMMAFYRGFVPPVQP